VLHVRIPNFNEFNTESDKLVNFSKRIFKTTNLHEFWTRALFIPSASKQLVRCCRQTRADVKGAHGGNQSAHCCRAASITAAAGMTYIATVSAAAAAAGDRR